MLEPKSESATGTGADTNGARPEVAGVGASADSAPVGSDELVSGGGNRWPRQETLALLQIRSDMDGVFRDSSHKGPLWDEISRKMAEMGYRRSAKKCREKFENVYKYHRRTKDGRSGKSDGKTYRFFDQLEALESNHSSSSYFLPPPEAAVPIAMAMPPPRPPPPLPTPVTTPAPVQNASYKNPMSFPSSPSGTPSSSSMSMSTSSDEEITGTRSRRKRKWKDFFEKLTKDVVAKQEEFERKFLEAIDRREGERRAREEAWKAQEMARLKREHDILVHERSMVSAKESALLSFLQKLSDHQQIPLPPSILHPPPPTTPTFHSPIPVPISEAKTTTPVTTLVTTPATTPATAMQVDSGGDRSASRWPKEEIEALIRLRTNMEHKYQEGVPKGPLWEEISSAMRSQGYNRNPKRCKEKWENINKYYRKVKESNKKRRVDSKTCPYYYQLEALYAGKSVKSPAPPVNDEVNDVDDDDDDDGGYEIAGSTSGINGGDGGVRAEEGRKVDVN